MQSLQCVPSYNAPKLCNYLGYMILYIYICEYTDGVTQVGVPTKRQLLIKLDETGYGLGGQGKVN